MNLVFSIPFIIFGSTFLISSFALLLKKKSLISLPVFASVIPKNAYRKYQLYTQFISGVLLLLHSYLLINIGVFTWYYILISAFLSIILTIGLSHIKFLLL